MAGLQCIASIIMVIGHCLRVHMHSLWTKTINTGIPSMGITQNNYCLSFTCAVLPFSNASVVGTDVKLYGYHRILEDMECFINSSS
jgi:hypothetical protein